MKEYDRYIKKRIKESRRRIILVRMTDHLIFGLVIGVAVAAFVMSLSLIIPMYYAYVAALLAVICGVVSGAVLTVVRCPDMKQTALLMDAKGLQERVITSLEMAGQDDAFAQLVKADTERVLQGFTPDRVFPFQIKPKRLVILCALSVVLAVAGLIDSPARKQARNEHEIAMEAKDKAKELADRVEKLEKQGVLDAEQKKELAELLAETKTDLKEADSQEDLEKAEARLQKKLEQQVKNAVKDNKSDAAKALLDMAMDMNAKLPDDKQQALKQQFAQMAQATKSLQDMEEQLKTSENLTDEQLKQMQEQIEQVAANLTDEQLKELLDQIAANMNAGQMDALSDQIASAMSEISASQAAMINDALDGNMSLASGSGSADSGDNDGSGSASASSSGSGQGSQGGSGGQQGQGGNGQSGGGTGNGGSGTGASDNAGNGWYQGSDQGAEKKEQYAGDTIAVPENYQDNDTLKGTASQGEQYKQHGGPSVTWSGNKVDYQSVIGDYQNRAYQRIEGGNYPADVQETIKGYFESLNQ